MVVRLWCRLVIAVEEVNEKHIRVRPAHYARRDARVCSDGHIGDEYRRFFDARMGVCHAAGLWRRKAEPNGRHAR